MLAPAGPVASARPASIRASLRVPATTLLRTRWEWDDGQHDDVELPWASIVRARVAHRYAGSGVYRVRVRAFGQPSSTVGDGTRYVVVRGRGQLGASGWIRDPSGQVPFGFLITPGTGRSPGTIVLRCLLGDSELSARELGWAFAGSGSVHFGGEAVVAGGERHPYRVDLAIPTGARPSRGMTISLYAPGSVPGHDAPIRRVGGLIRPGAVDAAMVALGR